MKYYNYRGNKITINNPNKSNLLYKQGRPLQIYKNKYIARNKFNNQINGYNYNLINTNNYFPPTENSNYIKSNDMKLNGDFNQDINFIKIKMGFDLLTQKLNSINDNIKLFSESNKRNATCIKNRENDLEIKYFRDRIRNKNQVLNNN